VKPHAFQLLFQSRSLRTWHRRQPSLLGSPQPNLEGQLRDSDSLAESSCSPGRSAVRNPEFKGSGTLPPGLPEEL
jgi:hypothetical protein